MRDIKFRGKALKDGYFKKGEWVYGSLQVFKGYSVFDEGLKNFFSVDSKTVGQYTGLKDKNGKEIYEGDICIVSCKYFNIRNQKSKVIFKDGCFCFQYGCTDDYVKIFNAWGLNSIEVVGNIHDNEDLENKLKGEVCTE